MVLSSIYKYFNFSNSLEIYNTITSNLDKTRKGEQGSYLDCGLITSDSKSQDSTYIFLLLLCYLSKTSDQSNLNKNLSQTLSIQPIMTGHT